MIFGDLDSSSSEDEFILRYSESLINIADISKRQKLDSSSSAEIVGVPIPTNLLDDPDFNSAASSIHPKPSSNQLLAPRSMGGILASAPSKKTGAVLIKEEPDLKINRASKTVVESISKPIATGYVQTGGARDGSGIVWTRDMVSLNVVSLVCWSFT
jgi:hypothetical protein